MANVKSDGLAKNASKAAVKKRVVKSPDEEMAGASEAPVVEKVEAVVESSGQGVVQLADASAVSAQEVSGAVASVGEAQSALSAGGLTQAAPEASGFSLSDLGWIGLGVLGVGGVAAAASGGGGGGSSQSPAPTPAPVVAPTTTTLSGSVVAGSVVAGNDLKVTALKADGTLLGSSAVNSDGTYAISYTEKYTGKVLLKVVSSGGNADYIDEATKAGKDLDSTLYSVVTGVVPGGSYKTQITPLTELALKILGVSESNFSAADGVSIDHVSASLAKLLGLSADTNTPLFKLNAAAVTDGTGQAATYSLYGGLLAAISGAESTKGITTDKVIDTIAAGFVVEGGELKWKDASGENADAAAARNLLATGLSRAIQTGAVSYTDAADLQTAFQGGSAVGVMIYSDAVVLNADQTSVAVYFKLSQTASLSLKDINVSGGTLANLVLDTSDSTNTTYKANFFADKSNDLTASISIAGNTVKIGSAYAAANGITLNGDTQRPGVDGPAVSVLANGSTSADTLKVGDVVTIQVDYGEVVKVVGKPGYGIEIGGTLKTATYVSGSGTSKLSFQYVIQSGDEDGNGLAVSLSPQLGVTNNISDSIVDLAGNFVATPTQSMVTPAYHPMVDAVPPVLQMNSLSATHNGFQILTEPIVAGDKVMVTLGFNEGVVVTEAEASARMQIKMDDGSYRDLVLDTASTPVGTIATELIYSYTVAKGDVASKVVLADNPNFAPHDVFGNVMTGGTHGVATKYSILAEEPSVKNLDVLSSGVLDVRSNIVLDMGMDVLATGKVITLVNHTDPSRSFVLKSDDTSVVNISGSIVTINLSSDLDFASHYELAIAEGAFVGKANGLANVMLNTSAVTFTTVDPGYSAVGDTSAAVQSYSMSADGKSLVAAQKWLSIENLGSDTAMKTLDASTGDYAFYLVNQATNKDSSTGSWLSTPEVAVNATHVSLKNFVQGSDILYFDNKTGQPVATFDQIMTVKPGVSPLGYNLASGSNGEGGPAELEFSGTPAWTNALLAASGTVVVG